MRNCNNNYLFVEPHREKLSDHKSSSCERQGQLLRSFRRHKDAILSGLGNPLEVVHGAPKTGLNGASKQEISGISAVLVADACRFVAFVDCSRFFLSRKKFHLLVDKCNFCGRSLLKQTSHAQPFHRHGKIAAQLIHRSCFLIESFAFNNNSLPMTAANELDVKSQLHWLQLKTLVRRLVSDHGEIGIRQSRPIVQFLQSTGN